MSPSQPPPPLDDPSVLNPLECPPLKWGLVGCGRVCHDFTQALKHLPTASVVACSARDLKRAKEFAAKHGIPKAYGSYDELVADANVDIVYVGNVHAFRRATVEKSILACKHTFVEKPFACTVEDAEYLIKLARERNLFIMEGMWTRFFPAFEMARRLVFGSGSESGILGEVACVISDFHFNASDSEEYPTSFFYSIKDGGGANLLVGPYPVAAATAFFPNATPQSIKASGQVDQVTGVDLQVSVTLSYAPTSKVAPALDPSNTDESTPKLPGSGLAVLTYGMVCESEEKTCVIGTKGRLIIETPSHCPTRLTVAPKAVGRGQTAGVIEYEFPLPEDTDAITEAGGYFYPNSAGFCYEAAAAARCIAAGKSEAPQMTLKETMILVSVLEEVRRQLGTKSVYEG